MSTRFDASARIAESDWRRSNYVRARAAFVEARQSAGSPASIGARDVVNAVAALAAMICWTSWRTDSPSIVGLERSRGVMPHRRRADDNRIEDRLASGIECAVDEDRRRRCAISTSSLAASRQLRRHLDDRELLIGQIALPCDGRASDAIAGHADIVHSACRWRACAAAPCFNMRSDA